MIRPGDAVQFSLLGIDGDADASGDEEKQASSIRFDAKLPLNESAAFLGLEGMVKVMTQPLLFPDNAQSQNSEQQQASLDETTRPKVPTPKPTVAEQTQNNNNVQTPSGNLAPTFKTLPGPKVKLTGTWLTSLPAGLRLDMKATHYWTSADLSSAGNSSLTFYGDGQFEIDRFSVSGGLGGTVDSVSTSDKTGSTGAVYGNTNPGGSGTTSTALNQREGMDPSKYGTYHISNNKLELRYANGKTEAKPFKTDGYRDLEIGDKHYRVSTPKNWEKRDADSMAYYRHLNGSYRVSVTHIVDDISNGLSRMKVYLERIKAKNIIKSAGPLQEFKGPDDRYRFVKTTAVYIADNGTTFNRDLYLKFGGLETYLLMVDRYAGAKGEQVIAEFIDDLD